MSWAGVQPSRIRSLISWGEVASSALTDHHSSDGVTKNIL